MKSLLFVVFLVLYAFASDYVDIGNTYDVKHVKNGTIFKRDYTIVFCEYYRLEIRKNAEVHVSDEVYVSRSALANCRGDIRVNGKKYEAKLYQIKWLKKEDME